MDKIIALVSGLDSFCYLGQYIDKYNIEVLIFNYGQRAQNGIEQMTYLIDSLRAKHPHLTRRTLDISSLKFAYPDFQQTADHPYPKSDYDSSVVLPLRNTIFISIAMAYAQKIEAKKVLIGATTDDSEPFMGLSKFPNLNPSYLLGLEKALDRGRLPWAEIPVEIWSPARQGMSKGKNLRMGCEIFGEDLVCQTYSCYMNSEQHCGLCYGCKERQKVFAKTRIVDKTEYEG